MGSSRYEFDTSGVEVVERATEYMNKFVEVLQLHYPHFTSISEIQVAHLVEISCRLMGLNFNDYIPSPSRPWEDVQGIILSLQDNFGKETFKHLSPRYIAARNPTHLLSLLQIFNSIYEHGRKEGHNFLPATFHERTVLDDTRNNRNGKDDSSFITEVSTSDMSTSGSTMQEVKFNFVFDETDHPMELGTETDTSEFQTATEGEEGETQFLESESEEPPPLQSLSGIVTSTPAKKSESTTSRLQRLPITEKQPTKPKDLVGTGLERIVAVGTIRDKGQTTNAPDICNPVEIERFTDDAFCQLSQIHKEIQGHLRNKLAEIEKRICNAHDLSSWNAPCSLNSPAGHTGVACAVDRRRNKLLPPCDFAKPGPLRFDYFGKPYRERFPTFHGGIIKSHCHTIRSVHASKRSTTKKKGIISTSEQKVMESSGLKGNVASLIEQQLKSLQETYNDELKFLKKEFSKVMKQGGHNTFERIKEVWRISNMRLQKHVIKIVDSITEAINTVMQV